MSDQVRLYINSGEHICKPAPRLEDIKAATDDPDVVFVEGSESSSSHKEYLKAMLIGPLLLFPALFWSEIILDRILSRFGYTDDNIIEELVEEGARKEYVDISHSTKIIHDWKIWAASNWVPIVGTLYIVYIFSPVIGSFVLSTLLVVSFLFLISFTLFLQFLASTKHGRDYHMAWKICNHDGDYDEAVLICGGDHHEQISSLLGECPELELIEKEKI